MTNRATKCATKEEFHAQVKRGLAEFTTMVVDADTPFGVIAIVDLGEGFQEVRIGNDPAIRAIEHEMGRPNIIRINVAWYVLVFGLGLLLGVWL